MMDVHEVSSREIDKIEINGRMFTRAADDRKPVTDVGAAGKTARSDTRIRRLHAP